MSESDPPDELEPGRVSMEIDARLDDEVRESRMLEFSPEELRALTEGDEPAPEGTGPEPETRHETRRVRAGLSLRQRVLRLFLWTFIAIVSLIGSALYHINTAAGREVVRAAALQALNDAIPGEIRIGDVEELTPWQIQAREVTILDPDARVVVHVHELVATPDLRTLLALIRGESGGAIALAGVRIRGGEVFLHPDEDGVPSIAAAFDDGEPGSGGPGPKVLVEDIHLDEIMVSGSVPGFEDFRVAEVSARGAVHVSPEAIVDIPLYRASGRLEEPFDAEIERVQGMIWGDAEHGIELYARVRRGEDRVQARFRYGLAGDLHDFYLPAGFAHTEDEFEPSATAIALRTYVHPLSPATVVAAGYPEVEVIAAPVRGDAVLGGPLDDLRVFADLESDAGPVVARIRLGDGSSFNAEMSTAGVALERLLAGGPEIPLAGTARLQLDRETGELAVEGELARFRAYGVDVPRSTVRARVVEGDVIIEDARVRSPAGTLRASGRVDTVGNVRLAVRGSLARVEADPNVRRFVPGLRGGLQTTMDVRVSPMGRTRLQGHWVFTDVHYSEVSARRIEADGLVEIGASGGTDELGLHLALALETLRAERYPLGSGRGRIEGDGGRYAISTELGEDPRSIIAAGVLSLGAATQVNLSELRLEAPRSSMRGALGPLRIGRDGSIDLAEAHLRAEEGRVTARGFFNPTPSRPRRRESVLPPPDALGLELEMSDFRLEHFAPWIAAYPDSDTTKLAASLAGEASGSVIVSQGPGMPPSMEVDLLLAGASFGTTPYISQVEVALFGTLRDQRLAADLSLGVGAQDAWSEDSEEPCTGRQCASSLDVHVEALLDPEAQRLAAVRDASFELSANLRDIDLRLANIVDPELPALRGEASGELGASGIIDVFDFGGRVDVPNLRVDDVPAIRVASSFGYTAGALRARVQTGDAFGDLLEAEGSVLLDLTSLIAEPELLGPVLETAPWRIAARLPPRSLASLPVVGDKIPLGEILRASGTLSVSGGAFRTRADLVANLDVEPAGLELPCGVEGRPRGTLNAALRDGELSAELAGMVGARRVLFGNASATLPIAQWLQDPESFAAPSTDVELVFDRAATEEIPIVCELFAGDLTAHLVGEKLFSAAPTVEGTLYSDTLRVRTLVPELRGDGWVVAEETPAFRLSGDVHASRSNARSDLRFDWWNGGESTVSFETPMLWEGTDAPVIEADAPARAELHATATPLGAFMTTLDVITDVEGELDGDVFLEGTLAEPSLAGSLRLVEGRAHLPSLGQRLQGVVGSMVFEERHITLQGFQAADENGVARLAGDLALGFDESSPLVRLDLQLDAEGFPVRSEGSIMARVSGGATFRAQYDNANLSGALGISRLDVVLPEQASRSPLSLSPHPDIRFVDDLDQDDGDGSPIAVRLDVDASRPITIRGQDFEAQLTAALVVRYKNDFLSLGGDASITEGNFEIIGKRFRVEQGAIVFDDNDSEFDPLVNLVAVHELRGTNETITVTASGHLSEPQINFSSTVTNDRFEIIALLLGGNVRSDGQEADAAAQNFLTGVAGGALTMTLREEFGRFVPLISVEGEFTNATIRAGYRFDDELPEALRQVITGIYVEGFVSVGSEAGAAGSDTGSSGQAQDLGVTLELNFPYSIVNTNTIRTNNQWSVDLTWQP